MTSGITETAGALGGAALGAIVGMGTGGDDIITNMGIGAGIGDKVGAAVADVTVGSLGNISDYNYNRKKLNSELQKSESKKINAKNEYEQLVNQINNNKNNKSNNTNSNNSNNNVYKNDIVQENYKKAVAAKRNGNMKEYEFYRTKAAGAAQALKKQQTESEKQAKDAINNAKKTMGRSNNNNRRITKNNNFNIDNNVDNIY